MAAITNYFVARHLRAESSAHVLFYRRGKLELSGQGLAFWFQPMSASVAEVPVDDREVPLAVSARTSDYQDVTVQGVVTYRVTDPEALAKRIDFGIDIRLGVHLYRPLEKIALLLAQLAQQHASGWVSSAPVRAVLMGAEQVREKVRAALDADQGLQDLGIAITTVRISSLAPSPDLDRALEAPMREQIQQEADEAAFSRRALAVEKERAIKENELQNEIALAKREEELIAQRGENEKRKATLAAEAAKISSASEAQKTETAAEAQAKSIRLVEGARVEQERARMAFHEKVSPAVLSALAAREIAGKLTKIEHLSLGGDALGPLLTQLASAGTRALEAGEASRTGK